MSFESFPNSINSLLKINNKSTNDLTTDKDNFSINNKGLKIRIDNNLNLYFTPDKNFISLSPIIQMDKISLLFQLYKLGDFREKIENKISKLLSKKNSTEKKTKTKEKEKDLKIKKIKDIKFINDCIVLSKSNTKDCAQNIVNKISSFLFNLKVSFRYFEKKGENSDLYYAKIDAGKYFNLYSDLCKNKEEAKLNALTKFINKFIPEEYSKTIIKNVYESKQNAEMSKLNSKAKFEKLLEINGRDVKLLRKKRKLTLEEYNKRLPYFNMLNKDKDKKNSNYLIDQDYDELYFINTENIPIDKILLGDPCIVDNHLQDFTYTPFKIFEMIRDTGNRIGIDFKIIPGSNNNTDFCHTNEATIISQKLGIKVKGFGNSKEEAENKCALNCLAVIFRNKFKTYYELHNYFIHKKGNYLDIILLGDENKDKEEENFKKKKIENSFKVIDLINEEEEENDDSENKNNENEEINFENNNNENENFIDEGISIINKSFSSNRSNSNSKFGEQLIDALSSNDNDDINIDNDNNNSGSFDEYSFSISKENENENDIEKEDFDNSLFYMDKNIILKY